MQQQEDLQAMIDGNYQPRQRQEQRQAQRGGSGGSSTRNKPSALFTDAQLESKRPIIERVIAILMLFVSFIGTVAGFNGGFSTIATSGLELLRTALALGMQSGCTVVEFAYRNNRTHPWYVTAVLLDIGGTVVGWQPILHPSIAGALRAIPGLASVADILADLIIVVLAALFAWLPENRLVRSGKQVL